MNRRSRPIASEQAEVAKRDQNVSLGDVEETETSLWLHIFPAAVQRQALLTLMPALGCSDTALRRDECGDPVIAGKHGHIYAVCGTLDEPEKPGFMIYVSCETLKGWTYAKRALSFARLENDGDEEGIVFLGRLPSTSEADAIRSYCRIRKKANLSEESLAQLRERGKQLAETRRAA